MDSMPDWSVWPLAIGVAALFIAFFVYVGRTMLDGAVRFVRAVQDWPATRRAMVEAEARAGGRYPLWYRAVRVLLLLSLVLLAAFLVLRRFS
ncbi:MAG TPA: hypothetical protein PK286_12710 [Devosia sp.]|nr:hypothetical protein [Devosia sp.]